MQTENNILKAPNLNLSFLFIELALTSKCYFFLLKPFLVKIFVKADGYMANDL